MEPRRSGLSYPSLASVYEGLEIPKKKRPEIFRGLQAMEATALNAWIKK